MNVGMGLLRLVQVSVRDERLVSLLRVGGIGSYNLGMLYNLRVRREVRLVKIEGILLEIWLKSKLSIESLMIRFLLSQLIVLFTYQYSDQLLQQFVLGFYSGNYWLLNWFLIWRRVFLLLGLYSFEQRLKLKREMRKIDIIRWENIVQF